MLMRTAMSAATGMGLALATASLCHAWAYCPEKVAEIFLMATFEQVM